MAVIPREFYKRPVIEVAKDLLGKELCTFSNGTLTSGLIVEVEAYDGKVDPAAHSFSGKTPRNESMFLNGGTAYVYFIYGVHHCVNVVTGEVDDPSAVLIRAIEPRTGAEEIFKRRGISGRNSTNGPGKVCEALGIDRSFDKEDLTSSKKIWILEGTKIEPQLIIASRRIGISKALDLEWRFAVGNNPYLSRPR